ncbi:hypothetical protein llap_22778 [Limosa lapponica baueri]|uniref:Uncharacterized protein n=1 Tax=Limosa lapponica baueri TaxID=1758121 RepID=A0A2I0SZE5_LIMLA|nr:hypothetical protein llap_22778 [Limosa lapponica baueri]
MLLAERFGGAPLPAFVVGSNPPRVSGSRGRCRHGAGCATGQGDHRAEAGRRGGGEEATPSGWHAGATGRGADEHT